MQRLKNEPSLFILLLLVSYAAVSAVLFTPGLPQISDQFGINPREAQLTMSIFLIGYAFGNLPYGPLSNRFGRKPAIYLGIFLSILGCVLVVFVSKFQMFSLFLLGRFLMAFGSTVGIKIAFTIIGDVYEHEKATLKISKFMYAFAIFPGLAFGIGGFLTSRFGWESCFYFLTGYGVFLFFMTSFLPETCPKKEMKALNITEIKNGYLAKLKNKKLITSAFLMGCGSALIYLFVSEAPFIGIDTIGLSPGMYGLLNFIPPVGMVIGSLITQRLTGKKQTLSILLGGMILVLFSGSAMFALFLGGVVNVYTLFLPMPILYIGQSIIFSNSSSLAMSYAQNKSNASAIMNFINLGTSVIALFLFESIASHQIIMLPLFFIGIALIMLVLRNRLLKLVKI